MLVIDTSALVLGLADPTHPAGAAMLDSGDLHAPHLIDIEFLHTVRRLERQETINETQAEQMLASLAELTMARYPHDVLAPRIWELRHNLTAYDAAFVALSETLDIPLLTADSKLAGAPGNKAKIVVVGRS